MAVGHVRFSAEDIKGLERAFQALGGKEKSKVIARVLNRAGSSAFTQVRRTLSKEVGLIQRDIVSHGNLRKLTAYAGRLDFVIESSGVYLPLKRFKPRQTRKGVTHRAWGKRTLNRGSFIVGKMGGHVFHRVGRKRLPIKKEFGPSIPNEMIKGQSKVRMHEAANKVAGPRIIHEMDRLMKRYAKQFGVAG